MTGGRHEARPGWRAVLSPFLRLRRVRLAIAVGIVAAVASGAAAVAVLSPFSDSESPDAADPAGPTATAEPTDAPPEGGEPGRTPDTRAQPAPGLPDVNTGFPDASNTGVPDGVELRRSGPVVVEQDGATVQNLLVVDGAIEVRANNVTIRNVRVTNEREFVQWGIVQNEGFGGLVVEDSEIFGNGEQQFASGISNHGGMITIRRVEIHTITDGIMTSHGVIEDSYLHSPKLFEGDHTDMIQTVGGSTLGLPLEIRNNRVINTEPQTSAVLLDDANGIGLVPVRDVLVEGNLFAGGGYTLYCGGLVAEGHDPSGIVIRNNVFSRELWPNSGYYGPVAYFDPSAPGNEWSGNVYDDGTPVELDS
ncbi:MAG TPA: hypothetical protein VIL37_06675 [Natronosporangium sp.]